MPQIEGILNLTPDSFRESSRYDMDIFRNPKVDIVDIGAVSSRPGAAPVSEEQEWARLEPVLSHLPCGKRISLDTTRSSIVRRAFGLIGDFIVNDISAGEDDPQMLRTAAELGLEYVAMHKRGTPATMDSLCHYENGIMNELLAYFADFAHRAQEAGLERWILDPGLGFAKTPEQNMEILYNLQALRVFGRPILTGPSNKRFTKGREEEVLHLCLQSDIVRLHSDQIDFFTKANNRPTSYE